MYQTSQINAAESTYPSANYQRNPWFLLRSTPSTNLDPPPEYSVSCIIGRTVPSEFQDSRDPGVCHQTRESQCCDPPPSYEEAVNISWYCYCSVHGTVSDDNARANLVLRTRSKCSSFPTVYHIVPYLYLECTYQPWCTCFKLDETATGSLWYQISVVFVYMYAVCISFSRCRLYNYTLICIPMSNNY